MNYCVIFAGGIGSRMNSIYGLKPKQFIKIKRKPILIHTLEKFCSSNYIDGVVVVVNNDYLSYAKRLIKKSGLNKILEIVPGGATCQMSIFNGLLALKKFANKNDIVLIHDGVRPMIDEKLIIENIKAVEPKCCVVSCVNAIETILVKNNEGCELIDRNKVVYARAPQTMLFGEILDLQNKAVASKKYDYIDTCSLALANKYKLKMVECSTSNIKITTPIDVEMFRGMINGKLF